MSKKLYKSRKNKIIDGVCGGFAEYFNIDPTIVRIIVVIIACLKGAGVIAYILACIIMPYSDETEVSDDDVNKMKSANVDEDDVKNKKSESKSEEKKQKNIHSDDEFNDYFKK